MALTLSRHQKVLAKKESMTKTKSKALEPIGTPEAPLYVSKRDQAIARGEIKPKEKGRRLTIKQRKFLKLYFETGNATKSALKVYDTKDYNTAGAIASQILKKLREPVKTMMEARGLSVGDLVETVQDARKAKVRRRNLETGEIWYEKDHKVRLEAVRIAGRWLGVEKPTDQLSDNLKKRIVAEEFFGK